jgi:sulfhydrogenase subunit beta (sulfur reductase)
MALKRIAAERVAEWIDLLIRRGPVYGPQARSERFVFDRLKRAADLRLDYDVTLLPPKKYMLPPQEVLLKFNRRTVEFESVLDADRFVLLGVHPYDFVAIAQLDKLFARPPLDAHYQARREAATVVVSDVQNASPDVFAGCMGNATVRDRDGFDALLTRLDDGGCLVDTRTEKGDRLLDGMAGLPDAGDSDRTAREQIWRRNEQSLRRHELKMKPEEIPALLETSYDHPVWAEKAARCYSCGSCNLVCPTCYCFNVQDELDWNMETGRRVRQWDGCMLASFARVAGGHNFRDKQAARYRHRYYRKGKYVWDMIGEIACVGCGRCINACTADIANPVEIFNRLKEQPA